VTSVPVGVVVFGVAIAAFGTKTGAVANAATNAPLIAAPNRLFNGFPSQEGPKATYEGNVAVAPCRVKGATQTHEGHYMPAAMRGPTSWAREASVCCPSCAPIFSVCTVWTPQHSTAKYEALVGLTLPGASAPQETGRLCGPPRLNSESGTALLRLKPPGLA
jgi:hypothetical protein